MMYRWTTIWRWKQWMIKGKEKIAYIMKGNNTWHENIIEHKI